MFCCTRPVTLFTLTSPNGHISSFSWWKWIPCHQLCICRGITIIIWAKTDNFRNMNIFEYFRRPSWTPSWILENAQRCPLDIMQILILHGFLYQNQQKTAWGVFFARLPWWLLDYYPRRKQHRHQHRDPSDSFHPYYWISARHLGRYRFITRVTPTTRTSKSNAENHRK